MTSYKRNNNKKRFSANSTQNHSHMSIDSDNMSQSTDYTQRSRPVRRKVSMATRRRSQLLYLEKYGLDQPNWHSSSHDDVQDNNNRPISVRNFVQVSSLQKRPARFIKPQKSYADHTPMLEFSHVHQLLQAYTDKVYMEGYLYKRNDLNTNGSSCGTKAWTRWYVELCGPVLTLWDAEAQGEVYPQYINITDAAVHHENRLTAETRPHLFSLNSAGANRFLCQAEDESALFGWIRAIRLSCFECARIQEIYTKAFISRPQFKPLFMASAISTEGQVQVRFPGSTGWKTCWAVVSNCKIQKRLFNKKTVPTNGHIMFFESRKAKYPMMTLENVVQAYTVYPESPKLINVATLFKIEGSLLKKKPNSHDMQLVSHSCSALVMTSDTHDLVRWLVGVFDAFRLYGRPETVWDDPTNPHALNFAEMCHTRLFLDPSEVNDVDVSYGTTLLGNKKEFTKILLDKVIRGIPPIQQEEKTAIEDTNEEAIEDTNEEAIENTNEETIEDMMDSMIQDIQQDIQKDTQQGTQQSLPVKNNPTHLRQVTYASDSEEEEEEQEQEESDSDDASLYQLKKPSVPTLPVTQQMKPMTPNTSKSGSEVSEVSPTKLTLSTDIDDDFMNAVLSKTQSLFSEPKETPYKKPFYAQPRSNSMMPLSSPMFGSTASVNTHWESSSVDARMVPDDNDDDDDDDNMPLFAQHSLLDQHHQQQATAGPLAKKLENQARNTGQSLVQVASPSFKKQPLPRTGLLGMISEKEEHERRTRHFMDERMLMGQHRMMQQQYMQPSFHPGMMPMMMPMMDPRMMPMMDPRMMPPPSPMMYNPQFMPQPPIMMSPQPQFHSRYMNDTKQNRKYYPMSSATSVDSRTSSRRTRH